MNDYATIRDFLRNNNTSDEEMTKAWNYLIETNWKAKALSIFYHNWYDNNMVIIKHILEKYRNKEVEKE